MAINRPESTAYKVPDFPLRLFFSAMVAMVPDGCGRPPFGASMEEHKPVVQIGMPETDCRYLPYLHEAISQTRQQLNSINNNVDCDLEMGTLAFKLELLNSLLDKTSKGGMTCDTIGEVTFTATAHAVDTSKCVENTKPSKSGNNLVDDKQPRGRCARRFCAA